MAVTPTFTSFILDQFSDLGPVHSRRMFGGAGLYLEDVMFGLLADDVLYLRTDHSNRPDFEAVGMEPFKPFPNKPMLMPYHEAPPELLEDKDTAKTWGKKAVHVARINKKAKSRKNRLRNIGPKSASWLESIGIRTLEDLKKRGVVQTYLEVRASGQPATKNLLYALQGAVTDSDWRSIHSDIKAKLVQDARLS
jgi:DNA transformation protein and related proteins